MRKYCINKYNFIVSIDKIKKLKGTRSFLFVKDTALENWLENFQISEIFLRISLR